MNEEVDSFTRGVASLIEGVVSCTGEVVSCTREVVLFTGEVVSCTKGFASLIGGVFCIENNSFGMICFCSSTFFVGIGDEHSLSTHYAGYTNEPFEITILSLLNKNGYISNKKIG